MSGTGAVTTNGDGSANNPFRHKAGLKFEAIVRVTLPPSQGVGPRILDGHTGRGQLRKTAASVGTPTATFVVVNSATEPGRADISISAVIMAPIAPGPYVFDIEFENDGDPSIVFAGTPGTIHLQIVDAVTK